MKNDLLRSLLIAEEGCKYSMYKDEGGLRHIGIGHNLENDQTPEELDAMEFAPDWNVDKYACPILTKAQVYNLFDVDVDDAIEDVFPTFSPEELDALGETRRAIILAMVFQMGGKGFRRFKGFIGDVKAGDFDHAALNMIYADVDTKRPSGWFNQSQKRCERAAEAMRTNSFEVKSKLLKEVSDTKEVSLDGAMAVKVLKEFTEKLKEAGFIK